MAGVANVSRQNNRSRHQATARLAALLVAGLFAVVVVSGAAVAATDPVDLDPDTDLDGNGTVDDPYNVTNASELQSIAGNLTAAYQLTGSINATNTSEWDGGDGFDPVGNVTRPFNGSFDGNGFEIENLAINRTTDDVGLFGNVGTDDTKAELANITLRDVSVTGGNAVGSLVGNSTSVKISNVAVTGGSVDGSDFVGGLVGMLDTPDTLTDIEDSHVDLDTVTGTTNVGGVIGSTVDGAFRTNILDSAANATVEGDSNVGGFLGRSYSLFVTNATTEGVVNASSTDTANTGGLVGRYGGGAATGINIVESTSSAAVSADGRNVGGLVGVAYDSVTTSSATGNVTGTSHVGGLVGLQRDGISLSFANGTVTGDNSVGGLVGRANTSDGTAVSTAYANGTVKANGTSGEHYGGLIGYHEDGSVKDAYATGTVDGHNNTGGLIGSTNTTGTVSIDETYAVGAVSGDSDTGGLIGSRNNTDVQSSYWDEDRTGQSDSDGGSGLQTDEMIGIAARVGMTEFTFTTWETVEKTDADATADGYPVLVNLDREPQLLFPEVDDNDEDNGNDNNNNGGGNTGGSSSSSGTTAPEPSVDQTIAEDGDTDITGGRSGDVVDISDETLRRGGSFDGIENIAVDGLSIELANDRDFWIDVETYELGEEDAVDAAADDSDDSETSDSEADSDESTDSPGSTITASFEAETETVSVGYVTVTHNLEPEDIANVSFEFSVRDEYLDDLAVDPENVSLYRQTDEWTSLSTEYQELRFSRYRFEADAPGFSSFAIGTNAPLSIVINGTLDQAEIEAGENATATATVNNRGQNPVTHTVNLTADGETVATETVTVDGGEIAAVPLSFAPPAGAYAMAVDEVSLGSLTVVADEPQPPWWLPVVAIVICILLLVVWYRRQGDEADEPTTSQP